MATEKSLVECLTFFDETLSALERAFRKIEDVAPKPMVQEVAGIRVFRYANPTIHLALFLKFARIISMLGALRTLLELSYIQEQGILQRALDEALEDIEFLAFADQDGVQQIHLDFLEAFWAEEFHYAQNILTHERRPSVPRRKISAHNSRKSGPDRSTAQSIDRLIQGVFSGYVHGAAPHILDLYDPARRQFSLAGVSFIPVRDGYVANAANYPYRAIMAGVFVSRRLGFGEVASELAEALEAAAHFIELPNTNEALEILARMKGMKKS